MSNQRTMCRSPLFLFGRDTDCMEVYMNDLLLSLRTVPNSVPRV